MGPEHLKTRQLLTLCSLPFLSAHWQQVGCRSDTPDVTTMHRYEGIQDDYQDWPTITGSALKR